MGVMLSLDRQRPARGRRRQGQHERHPVEQAASTLAAVRRYDPPPSGRLLARLARTVLARRGSVVAGPGGPDAAARDRSPRDSAAAGGSAPAA